MNHMFDLEYLAVALSDRNEDNVLKMNYLGLGHINLQTSVFACILYIIFYRNYLLRQSNILLNLWCAVLFGQFCVCAGYQIQYLYYLVAPVELVIFGVIFLKEFGKVLSVVSLVLLALGFKYIGIDTNYDFYYNTLITKYMIWIYIISCALYLTLVCVSTYVVAFFTLVCIQGSVLCNVIFLYKFGKKKGNDKHWQNGVFQTGYRGIWIFLITYTIGFYIGIVLKSVYDTSVADFVIEIISCFCYMAYTAGIDYITKECEEFRDIAEKATVGPIVWPSIKGNPSP